VANERAAHNDVVIVTRDGDDFEMLGSLATDAARLSVLCGLTRPPRAIMEGWAFCGS
jgi:hypothetical protein